MHTRPTIIITAALGTLMLFGGCHGPTKAGLEARKESNKRVSAFSAQVNYDQARQAFKSGQFEKARKEIDQALARFPDESAYHVMKGRICLETHRLEQAHDALDRAIELDENLAEAHHYLGVVYERWSEDDRATECYLTAFDLDSSNANYLVAASETLISERRLADARTLIEPRLSYFEHHAALYQLLGQIAMLEGDPVTAAAQFEQAVTLSHDDPMLLEDLFRAQFEAELYLDSLVTLEHLSTIDDTETPELIRVKGLALVELGRTKDARECFHRLTRMSPTDINAWIELAGVAHELGDFRRVGGAAKKIMALAPDRYEGYLFHGLTERHYGRLGRAVTLLQHAAQIAPDELMPNLMLGIALEESGDTRGAFSAYADAVRVAPNSPEARQLLESIELD